MIIEPLMSGLITMSKKKETDLKMPHRVSKYLVMTLNGRGPATMYLDKFAQQFINYAADQTGPVLELGAAYGFVSLHALSMGAKVIANDIDPRHLQILYDKTPEDWRSRLTLLPGEFPQDLNLENQSIAGCYVARMLGYLEPANLQIGFAKLFKFLKPNAKLFIVASTPFKGVFKKIIAPYEQRVQEGEQWPGYFTDLKKIINESIPDKLHFFDEIVLTRELERVGFFVEHVEMYERCDLPKRALFDGRESIVAIARKI